ncbi:hypothetical protein G7046_g8871 [Stylonectria norvegica]|nr:hypothetical protein G7046_g8871 [Stylonectria norvegica]
MLRPGASGGGGPSSSTVASVKCASTATVVSDVRLPTETETGTGTGNRNPINPHCPVSIVWTKRCRPGQPAAASSPGHAPQIQWNVVVGKGFRCGTVRYCRRPFSPIHGSRIAGGRRREGKKDEGGGEPARTYINGAWLEPRSKRDQTKEEQEEGEKQEEKAKQLASGSILRIASRSDAGSKGPQPPEKRTCASNNSTNTAALNDTARPASLITGRDGHGGRPPPPRWVLQRRRQPGRRRSTSTFKADHPTPHWPAHGEHLGEHHPPDQLSLRARLPIRKFPRSPPADRDITTTSSLLVNVPYSLAHHGQEKCALLHARPPASTADTPLAKARLVHVRLVSMALTGFFYTFKRPRTSPLMSMMKYDPIGTFQRPIASPMGGHKADSNSLQCGRGCCSSRRRRRRNEPAVAPRRLDRCAPGMAGQGDGKSLAHYPRYKSSAAM